MAELVYQTWERITGRPWSDAAKGGFTTGSYDDNIALQKKLLGGWNPYAAKAAPKAAAKAAAPKASTPSALDIQPGMWLQVQQENIALQKYIADLQNAIAEEQAGQLRRTTELQYATSPIDFVAYERYRRDVEEQGFEPMAPSQSDEDIQGMMAQLVGGEETGRLLGEFGVDIPAVGQVSRSQFQDISQSERDILSSFLRAGVETPEGTEVAIDPGDYYNRLAKSFVPTLSKPVTRYQF